MAGKGDKRRPTNEERYRKHYDRIFRETCPSCGYDYLEELAAEPTGECDRCGKLMCTRCDCGGGLCDSCEGIEEKK